VSAEILRRALPAGIVCAQNAYSLVARGDEDVLALCAAEGIAWVPYFPLGGAYPGVPKVTDEPAVRAAAESLGCTPSQVGNSARTPAPCWPSSPAPWPSRTTRRRHHPISDTPPGSGMRR
jgi:hypothetical protein